MEKEKKQFQSFRAVKFNKILDFKMSGSLDGGDNGAKGDSSSPFSLRKMLSQMKQQKRRAVLPLATLISIVLVFVAIITPWMTAEVHMKVGKRDQLMYEASWTLWTETATDYRTSKKGKTTSTKHRKNCRRRKLLPYEADDSCDRVLTSQGLVVATLVLSIVAMGSSIGLMFYAHHKQQTKWFILSKWIPISFLCLSAILIISGYTQWPGVASNLEAIIDEVADDSKAEVDIDISLSTGFIMALVSSCVMIVASIVTAICEPNASSTDSSPPPEAIYVAQSLAGEVVHAKVIN